MSVKKIKKDPSIPIANIEASKYTEAVSFIICSAGAGRRMRSYGAKCLLPIINETILERQIRMIKSYFENPEIILIVGFEADKIMNVISRDIISIENERFEETNVVRSLAVGLRAARNRKIMVINGDLVFADNTFENLILDKSFTFTSDVMHQREVGLVYNSYVENIMYDLPVKWGQILFTSNNDSDMLKKYSLVKENENKFIFEIINMMIEKNLKLKVVNRKILDIDKNEDINLAKEII